MVTSQVAVTVTAGSTHDGAGIEGLTPFSSSNGFLYLCPCWSIRRWIHELKRRLMSQDIQAKTPICSPPHWVSPVAQPPFCHHCTLYSLGKGTTAATQRNLSPAVPQLEPPPPQKKLALTNTPYKKRQRPTICLREKKRGRKEENMSVCQRKRLMR